MTEILSTKEVDIQVDKIFIDTEKGSVEFNLEKWKQEYADETDSYKRIDMLSRCGFVLDKIFKTDSTFRRWMLLHQRDTDQDAWCVVHYLTICKQRETVFAFKVAILACVEHLTKITVVDDVYQQRLERLQPLLLSLIHEYISVAFLYVCYPNKLPIQITLIARSLTKQNTIQRDLSLVIGGNCFTYLAHQCVELEPVVQNLVRGLMNEIIETKHWSCKLVTDLIDSILE